MSVVEETSTEEGGTSQNSSDLPFPPVTRDHIMHCSYHYWHPRYRTITPKARLIPLSPPFIDYLRADGIIVPPEDPAELQNWDSDSGIFSADEGSDDGDDGEDPSENWPEVHQAVFTTIAELGGKVVPKLNWSAPKDATWINATNSMECTTPNDIYLLLKSSDFVTHDLEHAFDGCIDDDTEDEESVATQKAPEIPYHLVLRKHILINPAVEFRCFVRKRKLVAICQRDPNHYDFLFTMQNSLQMRIQEFFDQKIRDTFPDEHFTFDVYIPPPHKRVWLMDFNPWAPRTDPILFSWLELLTQSEPASPAAEEPTEDFVRLSLRQNGTGESLSHVSTSGAFDLDNDDDVEGIISQPEFRLIGKDDPEAYNFNSPQYSAHKLPKDVVDAGQSGPGLREFAVQWKEMMAQRDRERAEDSDD